MIIATVQRALRNKTLVTTGKIVLAAVLLVVVCLSVDWVDVGRRLRDLRWGFFFYGLVLQWIVIGIGNHRLQILLRALKIPLSYLRTLKYNCIGYFFNLAFPGGTGGDVVKMFYVAREAPDKKAAVVAAILLDRVMGLLAVVMIATVALIATLKTSEKFRPLLPIVLLLLALSALGAVMILTKNYWKRYAWWARVERLIPQFVRQMINALHEYRAHKLVALVALLESIALQLLMCVIAWCFGLALGLQMVWHQYFVMFPILTLVITIPITPSGLGLTELFSKEWFDKLGQGAGAGIAFMLLLRLSMLSMAIPGLICFFLPGTHIKAAELVEQAEALDRAEEAALAAAEHP
jgi:uncharacterized protein (TIRG00374 family)